MKVSMLLPIYFLITLNVHATNRTALDDLKESITNIFTTRTLSDINTEMNSLEGKINHLLGDVRIPHLKEQSTLEYKFKVNYCKIFYNHEIKDSQSLGSLEHQVITFIGTEIERAKSDDWGDGLLLNNIYDQRRLHIPVSLSSVEIDNIKTLLDRLKKICGVKIELLTGLVDAFINKYKNQGLCELSGFVDSQELNFKESRFVQAVFKDKKYTRLGEILDMVSFNPIVNGMFSRLTASYVDEALTILEGLPNLSYRMGHKNFKALMDNVINFEKRFPSQYNLSQRAQSLLQVHDKRLHQIDFKARIKAFDHKFSQSSAEDKSKNEVGNRTFMGDALKELIQAPYLIESLDLDLMVDFLSAVKKNTFHWDELDELYNELLQKHSATFLDYLKSKDKEETHSFIHHLQEKEGQVRFAEFVRRIKRQNDIVWQLSELGGRTQGNQKVYGEMINEAGLKMALLLRLVQGSEPQLWRKKWESLVNKDGDGDSDGEEGRSSLGFGSYQRWDKAGQILGTIIKREQKLDGEGVPYEHKQKAQEGLQKALSILKEQFLNGLDEFDFNQLMMALKESKVGPNQLTAYHYLIMKLD